MSRFDQDRASLMFEQRARGAFRFLETDWGFRVVQALPTFVRYEKAPIWIQVYHGRNSFEIGVELGSMQSGNDAVYDLAAITEMGSQGVKKYRAPAVDTPAAIHHALDEAALLLRKYGMTAAAGDESIWRLLEAVVQHRINRLKMESVVHQVRPKADAAFRQGDYESAVRLYMSIEQWLSTVERKKLQIAKTKLSRPVEE